MDFSPYPKPGPHKRPGGPLNGFGGGDLFTFIMGVVFTLLVMSVRGPACLPARPPACLPFWPTASRRPPAWLQVLFGLSILLGLVELSALAGFAFLVLPCVACGWMAWGPLPCDKDNKMRSMKFG